MRKEENESEEGAVEDDYGSDEIGGFGEIGSFGEIGKRELRCREREREREYMRENPLNKKKKIWHCCPYRLIFEMVL